MINQEILNAITEIDDARIDADIAVLEAMSESYSKMVLITENWTDEKAKMFLESSKTKDADKGIMDRVADMKKKDESPIITILKFIPRVVKALFQKIAASFNKNKDKAQKLKGVDAACANMSKSELQKLADKINESAGEKVAVVSGNTVKIIKKSSLGSSLDFLFNSTVEGLSLYKDIKDKFDPDNVPAIKLLTENIKKVRATRKNVKESGGAISARQDYSEAKKDLLFDTFGSLGNIIGNFGSSIDILNGLSSEINTRCSDAINNMKLKRAANGESFNDIDQGKLSALQNFSGQLVGLTQDFAESFGIVGRVTSVVDLVGSIRSKKRTLLENGNAFANEIKARILEANGGGIFTMYLKPIAEYNSGPLNTGDIAETPSYYGSLDDWMNHVPTAQNETIDAKLDRVSKLRLASAERYFDYWVHADIDYSSNEKLMMHGLIVATFICGPGSYDDKNYKKIPDKYWPMLVQRISNIVSRESNYQFNYKFEVDKKAEGEYEEGKTFPQFKKKLADKYAFMVLKPEDLKFKSMIGEQIMILADVCDVYNNL